MCELPNGLHADSGGGLEEFNLIVDNFNVMSYN